mgnify:CR=1 FL=1|tara:strand:+ start:4058 stop:4633 length:576 start_codon:yes stop_codon:yes gene_type:complete
MDLYNYLTEKNLLNKVVSISSQKGSMDEALKEDARQEIMILFFQTQIDLSMSKKSIVAYAYKIAERCVGRVKKNMFNVSKLPDSAFRIYKTKEGEEKTLSSPSNFLAPKDFGDVDEYSTSKSFENEYDCLSDVEQEERLLKIESLPITKKQKRILAIVALDGELVDVCQELNMPYKTVQRQIRNIRVAVTN